MNVTQGYNSCTRMVKQGCTSWFWSASRSMIFTILLQYNSIILMCRACTCTTHCTKIIHMTLAFQTILLHVHVYMYMYIPTYPSTYTYMFSQKIILSSYWVLYTNRVTRRFTQSYLLVTHWHRGSIRQQSRRWWPVSERYRMDGAPPQWIGHGMASLGHQWS